MTPHTPASAIQLENKKRNQRRKRKQKLEEKKQKLEEKRKQEKKNREKAREEDNRSEEDDDEFKVDIHWVNVEHIKIEVCYHQTALSSFNQPSDPTQDGVTGKKNSTIWKVFQQVSVDPGGGKFCYAASPSLFADSSPDENMSDSKKARYKDYTSLPDHFELSKTPSSLSYKGGPQQGTKSCY
ncbi:hypothetical protein DAPPUDRAFT_238930 [Daphnia pulex]|uniref:Uncharacterized protein n=1 Tax=Daphnia pulex TaxID=6669 RepID=E9G7U2_DAPPU|nr:hypothetical protein DAPPUDRAFT_238930 [Daphnia pulex]|eukprot:EFX84600.1 hypothetical protein DAPPUDRAFT_238930 [Daphnia pulex]